MSEQGIMICVAMLALAAVNIAAIRYLGIFAFFVLAASTPLAMKLLDKL